MNPMRISVTAAIMKRDGKYFIARRNAGHLKGLWEFPGGKIEPGELPQNCLKRELHEEFGIEVEIGTFFSENIHYYDDKSIHLFCYEVTYVSGDFNPVDHDETAWVFPYEMGSYQFAPADIPIVDQIVQFDTLDVN